MRKILAVNLLILGAGLFLLELIFGNWTNPHNLNLLYIPKSTALSYDAQWLYPSADGAPILYRRDRYGFRGSYSDVSRLDLITMGGSTTDQRYVTEGKTWQDVLRARFAEKGRKLQVANAGIDGQTSTGHLLDFELWFAAVPRLKTRYFLFYMGWNDLFKDEDPAAAAGVLKEAGAPLSKKIAKRSALFYLYQTIKGVYQAKHVAKVGHRKTDFAAMRWVTRPLYQGSHEDFLALKLKNYESNIRELDKKIRALGAVPIFMTHASFAFQSSGGRVQGMEETVAIAGESFNGVDLYHLLGLMNRKTMDVCKSLDAVCLDLAREVPFTQGDFYDPAHNTPLGSQKIGDYLYEKLKDTL